MQTKKVEYLYHDREFNLEAYDIRNIKVATASASACIKSNFNSYIDTPSSEINNYIYPSATVLP